MWALLRFVFLQTVTHIWCLGAAQVALITNELPTVIADTRANVEKKQALTYEELQAEAAEAEADAGPSDSDEEDEFVYNPLKLPLGYDGKPIPYWLYKLHGLNQVGGALAVPAV